MTICGGFSRDVGGQIPEGFDPAVYGIPAEMCENLDRVSLWNIVCTVDAFLSSGFTPAELLGAVHPGLVSSTQGTGIGAMESLRSLYIDGILGLPREPSFDRGKPFREVLRDAEHWTGRVG